MRRLAFASLFLTAAASLALAHPAPPPDYGDLDRIHVSTDPVRAHFAQPPHEMPARALDRATVRAALARARAANLASFRAYAQRGVFPSNVYQPGALNVWRDPDGHLCAAATIIDRSGQHELVQRVADQSNFIRLADVRQGPLMDWILTSGFTQDEIATIQAPFRPVTPEPSPVRPGIVDAKMRQQEDARLRAKYAAIDRLLVAQAKASLDTATDRLMAHPQLAWQVIDAAPRA